MKREEREKGEGERETRVIGTEVPIWLVLIFVIAIINLLKRNREKGMREGMGETREGERNERGDRRNERV